jgi:hypothetical protein
MKCSNCDEEAIWLLVDSIPYTLLFEPMCDKHFHELCHMEGEMNLDFKLIKNITIEDLVKISNEKWTFMKKKYTNVLKLYGELKKKLD